MRTCDRCKDPLKTVKTLLVDKRDGTEYDFCVDCNGDFLSFLNPKEKPATELEIKAPVASKDRKKQ